MKHLKRNWKAVCTVFVVALLSGSLWWYAGWQASVTALAEGEGDYAAIAESDRDAMFRVLGDMGLHRNALVALNLGEAQAVDLVAEARAWWEANAARLAALESTIGEKKVALRDLEQSIRMGPEEEGEAEALAAAREALAAARAAYRQGLHSLRSALAGHLSDSQERTWAALEQGWGRDMPYGMLSFTDAQRRDFGRASRQYRLRLAGAASESERTAAQTAWLAALDSILTTEHRQIIAAYESYRADSAAALADAIDTVLPPADDHA